MLNKTQIILDQLATADRAHQKEVGSQFLLRCVKYVCVVVLIGFFWDMVFHLSAGIRLGILLAGLATAFSLVFRGWRMAFVWRNRAEYTARLLETRDSSLGSRLINLLQLHEQARDPKLAPQTRELARQAVENYSAELQAVPLENIARTNSVRQQMKWTGWTLLGFLAVLALGFHITLTEVPRFLDPFGNHPPYSFTQLDIVQPGPNGTTVPYGKGLIVKVKSSGHHPGEVFLTSWPVGHPEQAVTIPMFDEGGTEFNQQLNNIHTELIVYAHTKDHESESKQVHIGIVLTPQVEKAFVQIAPPAYTKLKPQEKSYEFKDVQVLEGSRVQFRLQSNRPLSEGWVEFTAGDKSPQRIELKKSGDNEVTGSFAAAESGRLRFGLVDVDGFDSQADYEGGLTVTYDLPPEIHMINPQHDAFVAMDFKVMAQAEASDDYGLSEVRIHCGLNGVYPPPKVVKYDKITLDSRETQDIDFSGMGVKPGDVITLFAEAVDNAPMPHLSRSQTVHLTAISIDDYNKYLRQQSDIANTRDKYAQLNQDLQELIEKQKQLGNDIQKLSSQINAAGTDAKQRAALAQQLDNLVAQQNELNQKLNRQADRMDHFVRQQPLYDVEQDLQQILHQKAQNIRASTQANDAAVRDLAQRSSPSSGSRQLSPDIAGDFQKASDDQVAQLSQTHQETEEQVDQPLGDISQMQELLKDFNLFEALYKKQVEISQQSQAYNRPGQLEREDQLALTDIAADEKEVGDALGQLQQKLNDDANAAEKLFPKAAQSGRELANQIGNRSMQPLAEHAVGYMLAGEGDQSFQTADRLRSEMERLFSQCQGGEGSSCNELDTYLSLHKFNSGNNFAQLALSHKLGGLGHGSALGSGEGKGGTSGYAVMDGSNPQVLGNESFANNDAHSQLSSPYGKSGGAQTSAVRGGVLDPDVVNGLNPVQRQSAATVSETGIEQYNDLVDNYFKDITTKKKKDDNEKSN